MAEKIDKKEMWLDWTHDALNAYTPDQDADMEESIDNAVEFAAGYADAMLDEYEERFEASTTKRRRKRKSDEDEE